MMWAGFLGYSLHRWEYWKKRMGAVSRKLESVDLVLSCSSLAGHGEIRTCNFGETVKDCTSILTCRVESSLKITFQGY